MRHRKKNRGEARATWSKTKYRSDRSFVLD